MTNKVKSKRALLRELQAIQQKQSGMGKELSPTMHNFVNNYRLPNIANERWALIHPLVTSTMKRGEISTEPGLRRKTRIVAQYINWATNNGYSFELDELFAFSAIEDYIRRGLTHLAEPSRASYRSELRSMTAKVLGELSAPVRVQRIAHRLISSPYTHQEVDEILFTIRYQPSEGRRKRLLVGVALGLGAGVSASELLNLRKCDIKDYGDTGIEILITATNTYPARTVWLFEEYEDLLRRGLSGLIGRSLVVEGRVSANRNAVNKLYDGVKDTGKNTLKIEQARMRNTWLIRLLEAPIPLALVMQVAGLHSARTLTNLVAHVNEHYHPKEINSIMKGKKNDR